ncbi:MAG: DUF488 domain-containing protein [Candidatus Helarchaeota archaeon]|nr:DUF488 domain-containing protein [Candidatus Helarchaeota archaeon]
MSGDFSKVEKEIYTIGHSNHPPERFIKLLKQHQIEVLVDVRSRPHSKQVPHFNKNTLKSLVIANGIKYLFLGKELGGIPEKSDFYDENGYVIYSRIAGSVAFLEAISRLETGILEYRVAIMCGEENPFGCHRRLLIGRVLKERGITIQHIRGNGKLQTEEQLVLKEQATVVDNSQQPLFNFKEETEWKSIRSVLQKNRRQNSSES